MSEDELLQLLQVPLDKWSPFYLATRRTLCKTGGLINISCNVMSQAVRQRYLETPVARTLVHQQLLLFFQGADYDVVGERVGGGHVVVGRGRFGLRSTWIVWIP